MGSISDFPSHIETEQYPISEYTSIMDSIWSLLRNDGLSEVAAAAVMGNMYQESRCVPTAVNQNELHRKYGSSITPTKYINMIEDGTITKSGFSRDAVGFGLTQWTYWTRKQALYTTWENQTDFGIGSWNMQMNHLLRHDTTFANVRANYLDGYSTATGSNSNLISASDDFFVWYEASGYKNTDGTGTKRATYTWRIYQHYTGTTPDPDPDPEDPDLHDIVVTTVNKGRYSINKTRAKKDEIIRIAVQPMKGTTIEVVPEVELTEYETGWSFPMLDETVYVTITFLKEKKKHMKWVVYQWHRFYGMR